MFLSPNSNNKPDSTVRDIQRMLNSIKVNYHHDWPYLAIDGIYGKESATAVRKYQIYRGISSQMTSNGPVLGDTTISYIKNDFNSISVLSAPPACAPKAVPKHEPYTIESFIKDVLNCIDTYDGFIQNELSNVYSQTTNSANALKHKFYSFVTRMDPKMRKLKSKLMDELKMSDSGSAIKIKKHRKRANNNRKKLVQELKKLDIVPKIEKFLASKGISGEIKFGKSKNSPKLKITNGGLLALWDYKKIFILLTQYEDTEEWRQELLNEFYRFLDAFIIAYAANVLADVLVTVTAAAAGISIPAVLLVVIIAIAAILIASLLSYLLDEADVSFSETAFQGFNEIISLVRF